ncbi:hypothetical protein [Yinghuangia soli]|uniref:Uncharacterized protein n=1 Tax=Yinghuangia soli TaxID=2908204 RepID=A0AA41U5A6_9ACTN|nr:hypothetical protein [Yinghuangia soli]MCF2531707.1 hypothetical protein [Yinghuangia soli]
MQAVTDQEIAAALRPLYPLTEERERMAARHPRRTGPSRSRTTAKRECQGEGGTAGSDTSSCGFRAERSPRSQTAFTAEQLAEIDAFLQTRKSAPGAPKRGSR